MEDNCPFCGAEKLELKICPTCHHTEGFRYGSKFACGSILDEDNDWFRHIQCYETQLQAQAARLAEAKRLLQMASVHMVNLKAHHSSHWSQTTHEIWNNDYDAIQTFLSQDPAPAGEKETP